MYRECLHFKLNFVPRLISVTVIGSTPAIRLGYREINISLIKNTVTHTSSFHCFRDLTFPSVGEFRPVTDFWSLSSKDSTMISCRIYTFFLAENSLACRSFHFNLFSAFRMPEVCLWVHRILYICIYTSPFQLLNQLVGFH